MSIIDTANHNVVSYTSGVTKSFTGQHLVVVTYKTVTDKSSPLYNIKRESKAVSVPVITSEAIKDNLTALYPHVLNFLQGVQKNIIRDMLDDSPKLSSISTESISLSACVDYLALNDESGRLTKKDVEVWFDANIADSLSVMIADKMGCSETVSDAQSKKILDLVASFRKDISALSGGATMYPIPAAKQLLKAVSLAGSDDVIASKFSVRLDKMINVVSVDYMDAL